MKTTHNTQHTTHNTQHTTPKRYFWLILSALLLMVGANTLAQDGDPNIPFRDDVVSKCYSLSSGNLNKVKLKIRNGTSNQVHNYVIEVFDSSTNSWHGFFAPISSTSSYGMVEYTFDISSLGMQLPSDSCILIKLYDKRPLYDSLGNFISYFEDYLSTHEVCELCTITEVEEEDCNFKYGINFKGNTTEIEISSFGTNGSSLSPMQYFYLEIRMVGGGIVHTDQGSGSFNFTIPNKQACYAICLYPMNLKTGKIDWQCGKCVLFCPQDL